MDFSEEAALAMYSFESTGKPKVVYSDLGPNGFNGYAVGKHWMDVTLAMWQEDIRLGLLFKEELYEDPALSQFHWFLEKTIGAIDA